MSQIGPGRCRSSDLLIRPPDCGEGGPDWMSWIVDPVRQIEALDDLFRRGLLTAEDFERQKLKVLYL